MREKFTHIFTDAPLSEIAPVPTVLGQSENAMCNFPCPYLIMIRQWPSSNIDQVVIAWGHLEWEVLPKTHYYGKPLFGTENATYFLY